MQTRFYSPGTVLQREDLPAGGTRNTKGRGNLKYAPDRACEAFPNLTCNNFFIGQGTNFSAVYREHSGVPVNSKELCAEKAARGKQASPSRERSSKEPRREEQAFWGHEGRDFLFPSDPAETKLSGGTKNSLPGETALEQKELFPLVGETGPGAVKDDGLPEPDREGTFFSPRDFEEGAAAVKDLSETLPYGEIDTLLQQKGQLQEAEAGIVPAEWGLDEVFFPSEVPPEELLAEEGFSFAAQSLAKSDFEKPNLKLPGRDEPILKAELFSEQENLRANLLFAETAEVAVPDHQSKNPAGPHPHPEPLAETLSESETDSQQQLPQVTDFSALFSKGKAPQELPAEVLFSEKGNSVGAGAEETLPAKQFSAGETEEPVITFPPNPMGGLGENHYLQGSLRTPPEAPVFVNFPGEVIPQIVERIGHLVTPDAQELRLRLKPEFLGEILVRVRYTQGMLTAEIITRHPAVRELLASQLDILQQRFQEVNLPVEHLAVSVQSEGGHSFSPDGDTGARASPDAFNAGGEGQKENTHTEKKRTIGLGLWGAGRRVDCLA